MRGKMCFAFSLWTYTPGLTLTILGNEDCSLELLRGVFHCEMKLGVIIQSELSLPYLQEWLFNFCSEWHLPFKGVKGQSHLKVISKSNFRSRSLEGQLKINIIQSSLPRSLKDQLKVKVKYQGLGHLKAISRPSQVQFQGQGHLKVSSRSKSSQGQMSR